MSKPFIHAKSSARKYGGKPEDYEEIHSFMDSSKAAFPTNAHRALTHNAWFIFNILERIKFHNSAPCTPDNRFPLIINSDGREVSVRDIGEQHILEDYKGRFIPSAADFLNEMEFKPWMDNGNGVPPSFAKIYEKRKEEKKKPENIVYDGSSLITPGMNIPKTENLVLDGSNIAGPEFVVPEEFKAVSGRSLVADGGNPFAQKEVKLDISEGLSGVNAEKLDEMLKSGKGRILIADGHFHGKPLPQLKTAEPTKVEVNIDPTTDITNKLKD